MNRLGTLAMISVSSLFVGVALLVGDGIGYAQQRSDSDNVKAAVDAFHAALANLDIGKMQNVWAQEPYVVLINPRDKAPAVGWDAVKKDWQDGVFGFWAELKLSPKQAPDTATFEDLRRFQLHGSRAASAQPPSIGTSRHCGSFSGSRSSDTPRVRSLVEPIRETQHGFRTQENLNRPKLSASQLNPAVARSLWPYGRTQIGGAIAQKSVRPPGPGPARPEHRPAATSRRSLQACIASLPLRSFLMSKTYFKSDHLNGSGSSATEECPVACIGIGSGPIHLGPVDFFRITKKRDETIAMSAMTNVP